MAEARTFAVLRVSARVFSLQATRVCAQALWLVVLARQLGATGYGTYSGIAGLAIAFSGFAGAGFALRLYRDVVNDANLFSARWALATRMLGHTCLVLVPLFLLGGSYLFPGTSLLVLWPLAISELLVIPAAHQVASAYSAHHKVEAANGVFVLVATARLMAAGLLSLWPTSTPLASYAILHLGTTALAVAFAWRHCKLVLRPTAMSAPPLTTKALRDGLGFSAVWITWLASGSADKAAALYIGGSEVAGHYSSACRIMSVVLLPIEALATTALPQLFRQDADSARRARLVLGLGGLTVAYGLMAWVVIYLCAPLAAWLLGADFEAATPVLELLAPLALLSALRIVGIHVLLGYDKRALRVGLDLGAMLLTAALMWLWVPNGGPQGAARALVWAEALSAILLWVYLVQGWARGFFRA